MDNDEAASEALTQFFYHEKPVAAACGKKHHDSVGHGDDQVLSYHRLLFQRRNGALVDEFDVGFLFIFWLLEL